MPKKSFAINKTNSESLPEFVLLSYGGHAGRDALRKQHSALFLAKAREEATLRALDPVGVRVPRTPKEKRSKAFALDLSWWR